MPSSVLFVPTIHVPQWLGPCFEFADRHGYPIDGVVSVWDDILNLILDGWRGVAVAGDRSHVPANRLPRWAFLNEQTWIANGHSESSRPVVRLQR